MIDQWLNFDAFRTMGSLPALSVLKNGFKALENQTRERKKLLEAQLSNSQSISSDDERWLDGEANLIDELRVVEMLEKARDYGRAFEGLDTVQRQIVEKLQDAGGESAQLEMERKKRKRMSHNFTYTSEI